LGVPAPVPGPPLSRKNRTRFLLRRSSFRVESEKFHFRAIDRLANSPAGEVQRPRAAVAPSRASERRLGVALHRDFAIGKWRVGFTRKIGTAILAVCLGTLGSLAAQAQFANANYGPSSLVSNTTGYDNSAFGQNSLYHKTTAMKTRLLARTRFGSTLPACANPQI